MPKGKLPKQSSEHDPPSEDYPDDISHNSSLNEEDPEDEYYEGEEHPDADPSGSNVPLKDRSNAPYRPPPQRRKGTSPAPRFTTQRRPTGRAKNLPCMKAPLLTSPDQYSIWSSRFLNYCFFFDPLY